MDFEYKYVSPESEGYTLVNLSRKEEIELLKVLGYTKFFTLTPVKYENEKGEVLVEILTSIPARILTNILFPLDLILEGLQNYKEVWKRNIEIWDERKHGHFVLRRIVGNKIR